MPLSPVETTPILLVSFTSNATPELLKLIQQRLENEGFIVLEKESLNGSSEREEVWGLTTTHDVMERQAEKMGWYARRTDTKAMEHFSVQDRDLFCYENQPSSSGNETRHDDYRDVYGLFCANDWSLLITNLWEGLTVLPRGTVTSELAKWLLDFEQNQFHLLPVGPILQLWEKELTSSTTCLRHVLRRLDLVDDVTPIHIPKLRDAIFKKTFTWYQWQPPVDMIREYYGDEIGYYFGWMGFLNSWLVVPGIFGLFTVLLRLYRRKSVNEDEFTPFYGIFTVIWSIFLLRFWDRQEIRFACRWGSFTPFPQERKHFFGRHSLFKGVKRMSSVTGKVELYYPVTRRQFKYVVSAIITAMMLLLAFYVMILSLNLQGFINQSYDPKRWNDKHAHPFYYHRVAVHANPGQMFDATSTWRSLIPVALHVLAIFVLNSVYRLVAVGLTKWENHETKPAYNNSLVLKRFLFEAFDCYVALFYLAFYERNVDRLQAELIYIFNVDTFRRLANECIVPLILQKISRYFQREPRHQQARAKKQDSDAKDYSPLCEQAELDVYDQYDDYMEIVIQFGYVILFASAYPLASWIAMLANWVQVRVDIWKLTWVCQRPRSNRKDGLGMWKSLVNGLILISGLTNCLLFGFSSNQLRVLVPQLYRKSPRITASVDEVLVEGERGWIIVFIIFGLERMLIMVGRLVRAMFAEIPEDVWKELERRQRLHEEERRMLRERSRNEAPIPKNRCRNRWMIAR
jgi:hypothetical protein